MNRNGDREAHDVSPDSHPEAPPARMIDVVRQLDRVRPSSPGPSSTLAGLTKFMAWMAEEEEPAPVLPTHSYAKIAVFGGPGTGKTTLLRTISDTPPLLTEVEVPATDEPPTLAAAEMGRLSISDQLLLYLFAVTGSESLNPHAWDVLTGGAVGAIVLADTRKLQDCFAAVSYCERTQTPYAVAINHFKGSHEYSLEEIRDALEVPAHVPVVNCDPRVRTSAWTALIRLVERALELSGEMSAAIQDLMDGINRLLAEESLRAATVG